MALRIRHTLIVLCCLLLAMGCTATPEAGGAPPDPTETDTPTATLEAVAPTATDTPTPTPTAEAEVPAPEEAEAVEATATPTPTPGAVGVENPPEGGSICQGLVGALESQILVGPSAAVGLDPYTVGSIPFAVIGDAPPFNVQGQAPIAYQDLLSAEWGTFDVVMDTVQTISGTCVDQGDAGVLNLIVNMVGEQVFTVTAEGFQQAYPWAGTQDLEVVLPIVEGASVAGEGWAYILHLLQ